MTSPINYNAIREAAQSPDAQHSGWIIRNAIRVNDAFANITNSAGLQHFPKRRDEQGRIPILPYQELDAEFRKLLLELASSTMIRSVEKICGTSALLVDPLYEQACMGSAIDLANIKADTLAHHSPCGLSPKLACVIVNQGSITLSNTLLKPGDLWVQPVMDLPLEVTSETDQVLFFIYYQHQSTIDHGTVELI